VLMLPPSVRIFVCTSSVDMRKGHDGLAALVEGLLRGRLYSGHLFVFRNRRRTHVKILWWDRGGLAMWYKRLEKGVFVFPVAEDGCVEMDATDLTLLLEGIDVAGCRRRPRWSPRSEAV